MADPAGESYGGALKHAFDRRLRLQFRSSVITSDAGLLAYRELDDAVGLTDMAGDVLPDARTGSNGRHALLGLPLQSAFGRLAGYEDVNDVRRFHASFSCQAQSWRLHLASAYPSRKLSFFVIRGIVADGQPGMISSGAVFADAGGRDRLLEQPPPVEFTSGDDAHIEAFRGTDRQIMIGARSFPVSHALRHFGGGGKIHQETVKYPRRRWPGRAVFGYNDAASAGGFDQRGYHATKMFGSSGDEELA